MSIQKIALKMLQQGHRIVPTANKKPLAAWSHWQTQPQTQEEFERLPFDEADGFAVLCGVKLKNNRFFVAVDVDDPDFNLNLLRTTQIERTPRGGYHFLFYSKNNAKSRTIQESKLELKGVGSLIIMAPSKGYTRINDNQPTEVEDAESIFNDALRKLGHKPRKEVVNIQKLLEGVKIGARDNAAIRLAVYFRKKGYNQNDTFNLLQAWDKDNEKPLGTETIKQKVTSAYSTKTPYNFQFIEPKEEPKIWLPVPEPVECDEETLENEILEYVQEHLDFINPLQHHVLTAFIKMTWIPEKLVSTPYLFFYGPKRSGKTRALEVLNQLCYRGILAANLSTAAMYFAIEKYHPTLLLDETEIYKPLVKSRNEILHLLNAGYRRDQHAFRVETTKKGERYLKSYDVFSPKALAGTRYLLDTLEDRCIVIIMSKNTKPVSRVINRKKAEGIRAKLEHWRRSQLAQFDGFYQFDGLTEHVYTKGSGINDIRDNRLFELFHPLYFFASDVLKEKVFDYALQVEKEWETQDETSIDAEVVECIVAAFKDEQGRFSTREVADVFNGGRPEKEHWKTQTIGWVIKRLGFKKCRTADGQRGWLYDEGLGERLKARYLKPSSQSNPSKTTLFEIKSQPNPSSKASKPSTSEGGLR